MSDFKIGQVVYLPTHLGEGEVDPYTLQKRVAIGLAYRPSCVGSPFRVLLSRSLNVLDLVPSLASLLKEQHELEEKGEWVPEVGAGLTVLQRPWQDLPFAELETIPERGLLDFVHVYREATGDPSREMGSGKISSVYAVWDAENQSVRYAYDVDAVDANGNFLPSGLLAVPEEALRSPEDVAERVDT